MTVARQIPRPRPYASSDDFREVFNEHMNSLYLLAFLLTADPKKAEQCFVSGLEDAVEGNPVFKEWAHSWAPRAVILNAVRVLGPRQEPGTIVVDRALVRSKTLAVRHPRSRRRLLRSSGSSCSSVLST